MTLATQSTSTDNSCIAISPLIADHHFPSSSLSCARNKKKIKQQQQPRKNTRQERLRMKRNIKMCIHTGVLQQLTNNHSGIGSNNKKASERPKQLIKLLLTFSLWPVTGYYDGEEKLYKEPPTRLQRAFMVSVGEKIVICMRDCSYQSVVFFAATKTLKALTKSL